MRVIIDRFEGEFAVCEVQDSKSMVHIEKSKLPAGSKAGDVLVIEGDLIELDLEDTARRKKRIEGLMDSLWEDEN